MAINVNGTTLTSVKVGDTVITSVRVRQDESSEYVTVFGEEERTQNIRFSGTTSNKGQNIFDDEGNSFTRYFTDFISQTLTDSRGDEIKEIISVTGDKNLSFSSGVFDNNTKEIKVRLYSEQPLTDVTSIVTIKYVVNVK